FLGVRSHKSHGSKMRPLARLMPTARMRRGWLNLLQRTAVTPARRRY
ncbi:MAG: beta-carotene hydroxylase, partial [Synechococcaceae bacterium WB9_4xC_028]|nr:beta-carotene hydroxylase [Synechococcaceae bacterium WB9_4xC_028]